MSIEELLEQMEQYRLRREQRDYRPDWLKRFVSNAAELFEPLTETGRVGYDCRIDDRGWSVCMYLGATEIVGGALDGHIDHASFRIDLAQLQRLFSSIRRFEWYTMSSAAVEQPVRALISIHGTVDGNQPIVLELLEMPPEHIEPGLHCRPNGMLFET